MYFYGNSFTKWRKAKKTKKKGIKRIQEPEKNYLPTRKKGHSATITATTCFKLRRQKKKNRNQQQWREAENVADKLVTWLQKWQTVVDKSDSSYLFNTFFVAVVVFVFSTFLSHAVCLQTTITFSISIQNFFFFLFLLCLSSLFINYLRLRFFYTASCKVQFYYFFFSFCPFVINWLGIEL